MGGKSGLVFPQIRVIVVSQPIDDIQHQELAEQLRAVGFPPVLFDTRPWFGLPGSLKAIANRLDSTEGGREAPRFRPVHAHSDTSFDHTWRTARSLRSTVCSTHPSLAAISMLVYPSIFQRATARSVSLPSLASSL